ncbi:hypothetical protein LINPERHAP1_LOCUS4270 [Linum perenne]
MCTVRRQQRDDNINGVKIKILTFQGKTDLEAYFDWERQMEFLFECHNEKKVKLVVVEFGQFTDYAVT